MPSHQPYKHNKSCDAFECEIDGTNCLIIAICTDTHTHMSKMSSSMYDVECICVCVWNVVNTKRTASTSRAYQNSWSAPKWDYNRRLVKGTFDSVLMIQLAHSSRSKYIQSFMILTKLIASIHLCSFIPYLNITVKCCWLQWTFVDWVLYTIESMERK